LDTQTGRVKLFTTADGLPQNLVSVCKRDQRGALWFGFYQGLSRFIPEPDAPPAPPPIFISDVKVNGSAFKKLSELGNVAVENLALASDQRQIQINFFALGFSTGETLRYQYKLGNTDWSELSDQRTVNLSLAPGSYRFLVRAVNAEGVSSQSPAVVSFSIAPPVWQRWWFLSLAALMIGGIAYATYRYRLTQLLKVERVRTRIATDLHDDIGASLSRMAILSEVVKQQTGGNGNQASRLLTEIADSARGLVDSMGDIVWSIDPRRDDLQSVIRRIRQFASDVLEAKDITWELRVPPEIEKLKLDPEERQHLFLIFKEGINNVVRHGAGTKSVSLSIHVEGRHLTGEINDDGCGFTPQQPDETRSQGRGGNGLPNMRSRAEQLGGRLEIVSSPGAGTRLTLKVPLR
jgi:signal transduction histidine kinase